MSQLPNVPMAELRPMIRKPRKQQPAQPYPDHRPEHMRSAYLCPELGRTCTRPNAYDAFDLPSLYGKVRRPYRFSQD